MSPSKPPSYNLSAKISSHAYKKLKFQSVIDNLLLNLIMFFYSKVFHVRSVTQGDVIRADAKEIPRIFQLFYAGEGEARRPKDGDSLPDVAATRDDKPGTLSHKGHELLQISYHMPTTCEVCPKPLWHMFRPPAALECRSMFPSILTRYTYIKYLFDLQGVELKYIKSI